MAGRVVIAFKGNKELQAKLRGLTNAESKKAILGAVRESIKVIQREAQSLAPSRTGALKRSIKVRAIRRSRKRIGLRVTTSKSDNMYAGKTFYAAFQEWGWKTGKRRNTHDAIAKRIATSLMLESRLARASGKGGLAKKGSAFRARQEQYFASEGRRLAAKANVKTRRQIDGNHFLKRAADARKEEALSIFRSRIDDYIKKVMAKRK